MIRKKIELVLLLLAVGVFAQENQQESSGRAERDHRQAATGSPSVPAEGNARDSVSERGSAASGQTSSRFRTQQAPAEDALVLFRQGNYDRAVQVCLTELESGGRSRTQKLDSYVVLCWSLLKAGRYRDVIRYGSDGLKMNTGDARLIFTISEAYFLLKDYKNAMEMLERYVRVAPAGDKLQQVYNYMGEIFLQWEEYNHAVTAFATAANIDQNVSAVWANLGLAKEKIKDIKGAKEAYRRALNLQSYNEEAKAGMARIEKAGAGR